MTFIQLAMTEVRFPESAASLWMDHRSLQVLMGQCVLNLLGRAERTEMQHRSDQKLFAISMSFQYIPNVNYSDVTLISNFKIRVASKNR